MNAEDPQPRPRANPVRTSGRGPIRPIQPGLDPRAGRPGSVAAVKAIPATIAVVPRQLLEGERRRTRRRRRTRTSGCPRSRTAAGRPRAARSVPGGVSRANAGIPIASPTTISAMPGPELGVGQAGDRAARPERQDQRERQAPPGVHPRRRARAQRPVEAGIAAIAGTRHDRRRSR